MNTKVSTSQGPTQPPSHVQRKLLVVIMAIFVVAAIAGGGYGLWYILLGPTGPAAVSSAPPALPSGVVVTLPPGSGSLDGTWNVNTTLGTIDAGTASFAGFRVQEQLAGVGGHTAVGRSTKVTGSMTMTGAVVSNVQVSVDMTALVSDDSNRDDQLKRQAIETNTFPTATFKLTTPIDLGTLPAEGKAVSVSAKGDLTLHGVTKNVTISLEAIRQGGLIAVAGSLPIIFSDYAIVKPTSFSVISVDDHGTMELHLLFTHA